ncbi:phasin family protein [Aromatoleum bremense]|uniref:TIGR01841 family phasin n=1 Tax=Aromatoleum bremense TaxID=76115 RepID=A0ABX1P0T9_9RHOO|nr:phasin family protein [Aromatoleum bremense]NMG17267.1 TIGR01841 family phasin [Aromatoleum bremense]QTQ31324.1 Phasin family protein [Aromatoleum bremense]
MIAAAEKFANTSIASFDTMTAMLNVAFNSTAHLTALNFSTSRSMLHDGASCASAMLDARNTGEIFTHETSLGQSVIDNALAYIRSANEIATEGHQAILQLVEPQIAEFNREITRNLDKAAKSVPAGSELAFAAVISALQVAKRATGSGESAQEGSTESQEETSRPTRKSA